MEIQRACNNRFPASRLTLLAHRPSAEPWSAPAEPERPRCFCAEV